MHRGWLGWARIQINLVRQVPEPSAALLLILSLLVFGNGSRARAWQDIRTSGSADINTTQVWKPALQGRLRTATDPLRRHLDQLRRCRGERCAVFCDRGEDFGDGVRVLGGDVEALGGVVAEMKQERWIM
jgi:hypothetical protein